MNYDKLRTKFFSQRPDLRDIEVRSGSEDATRVSNQVDDTNLSLSAWKDEPISVKIAGNMKTNKYEGLSEEALQEIFAPRPLTSQESTPVRTLGIIRAVKKNSFAGDDETLAKDFLVDEHEGLIGSQG